MTKARLVAALNVLCLLFLSSATSFAYRPGFDTQFFQNVDEIHVTVRVMSNAEGDLRELSADEVFPGSPLSSREIERAVFDVFKSEIGVHGVNVFDTDDPNEKQKAASVQEMQKPRDPDADPFDFSNTPEKNSLHTFVYVVLNHESLGDDREIAFGAISTKTLRYSYGKYSKASDAILEGISQPFFITSDKEHLTEELRNKTLKVFDGQRRWVLCDKDVGVRCDDEDALRRRWERAQKKTYKE